MTKPIIVANWKMNTLADQARRLVRRIVELSAEQQHLDSIGTVVLCPPFVNISIVRSELTDTAIELGGQNCWTEPYGAFTGEVSAEMLRAVGCSYVIVGHSERRTIFGEDDEIVLRKMLRAWEASLIPIVCVGETLHQRQMHQTWDVLRRQLENIAQHQDRSRAWVCAYEPVWAIGTGIAAEPEQIEQAHLYLRSFLDGHGCSHVPLIYGGSVNADNAAEIFAVPNVDGALVGTASLVAESFVAIIRASHDAHRTTT